MTFDLSVNEFTFLVVGLAVSALCATTMWALVQFVQLGTAALHVATVTSAETVGLANVAVARGSMAIGGLLTALSSKGVSRPDKADPTPFLSNLVQSPPESAPPFVTVTTFTNPNAPPGVVRLSTEVVRWLAQNHFNHCLSQRSLETAIKLYSHLVDHLKLWTPEPKLVYHDDHPTRVKYTWDHGNHHLEVSADEDGKVEWFHWATGSDHTWAGKSDLDNLVPNDLPEDVKAMIADHPAEDFGLSSGDDD